MTRIKELVIDQEYWIERAKQKDETISVIRAEMERIRGELEKVSKERDEARAEVERLKKALECMSLQRDELLRTPLKYETRPEPSRLEIAAMLLAACLNRKIGGDWIIEDEVLCALEDADKLIAAAKEEVGK